MPWRKSRLCGPCVPMAEPAQEGGLHPQGLRVCLATEPGHQPLRILRLEHSADSWGQPLKPRLGAGQNWPFRAGRRRGSRGRWLSRPHKQQGRQGWTSRLERRGAGRHGSGAHKDPKGPAAGRHSVPLSPDKGNPAPAAAMELWSPGLSPSQSWPNLQRLVLCRRRPRGVRTARSTEAYSPDTE